MSGSNLTCTSFDFFFFFNKVSVVSLSCALSVWLCLTLCVLMSWLHLMLRQYFEYTFFLFPLSPVPVCASMRGLGHCGLRYSLFHLYTSLVCLWPQLHVHVEVFIYISRSCCVNVCVWVGFASTSGRLDESKAWISLKDIEPVERSVAKFSD